MGEAENNKITVVLSKKRVVLWIIAIVSFALAILLGLNYDRYNYAVDLNETKLLKPGRYLDVDINHYLVKCIDEAKSGKPTGLCDEKIVFLRHWYIYAIPVGDGKYITARIYSLDIKRKLEDYINGYGENIHLTMRASKSKSVDDSWFDDVENFDKDNLVTNIVLKETSKASVRNGFLGFLSLTVISVILLIADSLGEKVDKNRLRKE